MNSPILPISLPPSSSSSQTTTSTTMLLKGDLDDIQQSHVLLIPTSSSSSSSLSSYEDEKIIEKKPFFSRAFSYTRFTNLTKNQKRRRRVASDAPLSSHTLQKSLSRDVGYITAETHLITRLGSKLLRCLGLGYGFITRFLALGCYSILIMPGLLQVGYYYYTSGQIRRNIVYGDQPRNRLDLYLPVNSDGPKPVIALITGGAWVIGYKAWGALLGQHLSERDFMVACIDYRNFPQATISEMVKDASQGISFLCKNIAEYGGDPNRIYLMGQSAGAHIAACVLVEQAIKESGEGESSSWSVSQIKAYIGLSGGYNLRNLVDHFHGRGLYRSMFLSMMEGEQSLERFSPEVSVRDPSNKNAVSLLPPIVLLHGVADYSIPSDSSKIFADALRRVGAQAELILYEGKTHTDLFVQDPFRGGESELINDIVSFIYADDPEALAKGVVAPPARRLVPEFMLKLAGKVSPF